MGVALACCVLVWQLKKATKLTGSANLGRLEDSVAQLGYGVILLAPHPSLHLLPHAALDAQTCVSVRRLLMALCSSPFGVWHAQANQRVARHQQEPLQSER